MSTTVVEAEEAFARRKFAKALKLANSVLLQCKKCRREGLCGSGTANACDATLGEENSEGNQMHNGRQGATKLISDSSAAHCHAAIRMQTPLTLTEHDRTQGKNAEHDKLTDRTLWHVNVGSEASVVDRAAAVAVQSSYEISRGLTRDRVVDQAKLDSRRIEGTMKNIGPFISVYQRDDDYDCRKGSITCAVMPLELAIMWIKFCQAMGSGIAASAAAELLGSIFLCDDSMEAIRHEEAIMVHCEDLLFFLLIEIIPRVTDRKSVDALLCQLTSRQRKAERTDFCNTTMRLSREVNPESLSVALERIDTLRSALDPSFSDILDECSDRLHELAIVANEAHPYNASPPFQQARTISSLAETMSNRSALQDDSIEEEAGDHQSREPASVAEYIRSSIIEPLWDSEDRWANRARVAALGATTYMLWRKRRRIVATTRSTGYAVLAPIREIVEAISPPH